MGNKIDLEDRQVSDEVARAYAKSVGADCRETSALTRAGIDEVFQYVANEILEMQENKKNESDEQGPPQKEEKQRTVDPSKSQQAQVDDSCCASQ